MASRIREEFTHIEVMNARLSFLVLPTQGLSMGIKIVLVFASDFIKRLLRVQNSNSGAVAIAQV